MVEAMAVHIAVLQDAGERVPEPAEADGVTILDPAIDSIDLRCVEGYPDATLAAARLSAYSEAIVKDQGSSFSAFT
jgi:hypothetical protein